MRYLVFLLFFFFQKDTAIQIFSEFNFNSGEYRLIGIQGEAGPNKLADSLGNFYIDDINVLNKIKKAWTFKKPGGDYACGYHYLIYLVKNQKTNRIAFLNLNCYNLSVLNHNFYFEEDLLRDYYKDIKPLKVKKHVFRDIREGTVFLSKIKQNDSLIFLDKRHYWSEYDLRFNVRFDLDIGPTLNKDVDDEEVLAELKNYICNNHPSEPFEISISSSSKKEIVFEVEANNSLYEKLKKTHPVYRKELFNFFSARSYWIN